MNRKESFAILDNLFGRWFRGRVFPQQYTAFLMQEVIEPLTIRGTVHYEFAKGALSLCLAVFVAFLVAKFALWYVFFFFLSTILFKNRGINDFFNDRKTRKQERGAFLDPFYLGTDLGQS